MGGIMDVLLRGMEILERLRTVSSVTDIQMVLFGVFLVFGIVNCILGFRLLRFWMMIFGFLMGAGLGFGASFFMGISDNVTRIAVSAGVGVLLAVIVFFSYKVGIFVLGAGLGMGIAVYVLHPTSSLVFFFCLLAGVGLGSLAMKWAKEVIITGTSLLGGAMAGMSLAKLVGLADFPYGIGLSAAFAAIGMLIQFATNKTRYEDEDEEEEYYQPPARKKKAPEKPVKRDPVKREPVYRERPSERKTVRPEVYRERDYRERDSRERDYRERDYQEPDYRERVSHERNYQEREARRSAPVDFRFDEDEYGYGLRSEKTVVYRPRKKTEPDLDLPLDSYAYDDSYGRRPYPKNSSRKKTYTVRVDQESADREQPEYQETRGSRREFYADLDREDSYDEYYDDPIDEDELDEEILREIMEEEDRASILPWKKQGERRARKEGRNGKRS